MKLILFASLLFGLAAPTLAAPSSAVATAQAIGPRGFTIFNSLSGTGRAFSPMSFSEAVLLAAAGSGGRTLAQFETFFGGDLKTLVDGISATRTQLLDYGKDGEGKFAYRSSNSLWGNSARNFEFAGCYLQMASDRFGASLNVRDFSEMTADGKEKRVVHDINQLVDTTTEHLISRILSDGDITPSAVAVILNAIFAEGRLQNPFSEIETGTFAGAPVSYMSLTKSMPYYEAPGVRAVSLGIGEEGDNKVFLDILVPQDGDVRALAQKLAVPGAYAALVKGLKSREVALKVPAGKIEPDAPYALRTILEDQGLTLPFTEDAEFPLMASSSPAHGNQKLSILEILTKAVYELGPFGFKAAAATAVMVRSYGTAMVTDPPVDFSVDRPALHVVRTQSGMPLFIVEFDHGVLYDQTQLVGFVEQGFATQNSLRAKVEGGTIAAAHVDGKPVVALLDGQNKVIKVLKEIKPSKE